MGAMYSANYSSRELYKGNDLVLIHLAPEVLHKPLGYLAPICLPDPSKPDLPEKEPVEMFYTGYGDRMIGRCVTNKKGPEKYKTCGHEPGCIHTAKKCELRFVYKNEVRYECLKRPTPSFYNSVCRHVLKSIGLRDFKKESYVFNKNGSLNTTCYPFFIKKEEKGWCATRDPHEAEDSEPEPTFGWGYCGDDEFQAQCNTYRNDYVDTRKKSVTRLNEQFCIDRLRENMQVEFPMVSESEYSSLDDMNVLCVGKNDTNELEESPAYQQLGEGDQFDPVPLDTEKRKLILAENPKHQFLIDGGGACFGDSGGPLFKMVKDGYHEKPVLLGVMSFLLWGACKSMFEPTYFTRVHRFVDFIKNYVPEDELCFG